jgi:hypothetical protein
MTEFEDLGEKLKWEHDRTTDVLPDSPNNNID